MAAPTPSFKEAVDAVNSSLWDSYAPHWLVRTYNTLGSMWIWFAGKCTKEEEAHGSALRLPSQAPCDNRRAFLRGTAVLSHLSVVRALRNARPTRTKGALLLGGGVSSLPHSSLFIVEACA